MNGNIITERKILVDTLLYNPVFKVISTKNDLATIEESNGKTVTRKLYVDCEGDTYFRYMNEWYFTKFLFEFTEKIYYMDCSEHNCTGKHHTLNFDRYNETAFHILTDGTEKQMYKLAKGAIS